MSDSKPKSKKPAPAAETVDAPEVNKGGRPRKLHPDEQTLATVRGLAGIMCTLKEAAFMQVSEPTFLKFKEDHPEVQEAWDQGKESGKASLRRKQFKLADTNATMAIFLGLNYLGQEDKRTLRGDPAAPIKHDHTHSGEITSSHDLKGLTLEQLANLHAAEIGKSSGG